ncbi:MAG: hypothetical protein L3J69_11970 [Desulfobacula sp.]|nr:hypothetical protein [Desulfobacula sp.]
MKSGNMCKYVVNSIGIILAAFLITGCLGLTSSQPENGSEPVGGSKSKKTTAIYHDFEDVLVPLELSVVNSGTVIVSSPGFTSGILSLKGRVDRRSLFNFFNTNMQKDNWNVISQIKSPGTTIMVFQKSTRTAVITIRDESIYTYVEVGVAPTVNTPAVLSEENLME